jgi:hypothetical protein
MIWGRFSGIIHSLIEMFGLLQEEQAAGEIQLNPGTLADTANTADPTR